TPSTSIVKSEPGLLGPPVTVVSPAVVPTTPTIDYSKYNIKKKSQVNQGTGSQGETGSSRSEPSDIVRTLMKSSIFDQDSKRLEHINEKYEGKDPLSSNTEHSNTASSGAASSS